MSRNLSLGFFKMIWLQDRKHLMFMLSYMVYPHTVCGWVHDPGGLYRSWISLVVSGQSRKTEEVYIYIRTYSGYPNITCSPIHSLLRIQ